MALLTVTFKGGAAWDACARDLARVIGGERNFSALGSLSAAGCSESVLGSLVTPGAWSFVGDLAGGAVNGAVVENGADGKRFVLSGQAIGTEYGLLARVIRGLDVAAVSPHATIEFATSAARPAAEKAFYLAITDRAIGICSVAQDGAILSGIDGGSPLFSGYEKGTVLTVYPPGAYSGMTAANTPFFLRMKNHAAAGDVTAGQVIAASGATVPLIGAGGATYLQLTPLEVWGGAGVAFGGIVEDVYRTHSNTTQAAGDILTDAGGKRYLLIKRNAVGAAYAVPV